VGDHLDRVPVPLVRRRRTRPQTTPPPPRSTRRSSHPISQRDSAVIAAPADVCG
jgi:hypothetical protein